VIDVAGKSGTSAVATPTSIRTESATPVCPKCNSEMKRRVARQGANAGKEFWGCMAYPKCNGIRQI